MAASRPKRFKKAIDPRENRAICSAVIRNLKKTSWLCDDHIIRIHQPRNIFAMHLDLSLNVSTPFGIYFILFYDLDSIAFYDFELVSFYDFDSIAFYDFELVSFYDFDLIPCSFMLLLVRSMAQKRRKPCTLN